MNRFFGEFFHSTIKLKIILYMIDYLSFLNRSTIFINCMISNKKFRNIVMKKLDHLMIVCHIKPKSHIYTNQMSLKN
jgi:hypothetical protein